jgi:hypothetical protein
VAGQDGPVSFDLGVLAIDGGTDAAEVAAMAGRCTGPVHVQGELDPRIAGFYERLRSRFPDQPPFPDGYADPWMSTPLDVGVDHVFLSLCFGARSDPAWALIQELAAEHGLTIWDPQDGSAHRPLIPPTRGDVTRWWRDLLDGQSTREQAGELARPWVEDPSGDIGDPITLMGLQHLHGFALTGADREHVHSDPEIRAAFERWLGHGHRFDADPDGWQRDRYRQAVEATLRNEGPDRARALANHLRKRGWLTTEDVTRLFSGGATFRECS